MPVPKYNELYMPLLEAIKDGKTHRISDVKKQVAAHMNLTEEDLAERITSGRQTIFDNRIGWAKTYLGKAGLIESSKRAYFNITNEGIRLLESGAQVTNELLLANYPAFAAFKKNTLHSSNEVGSLDEEQDTETPQETFERVYQSINAQLADDLLTEIMNQSAAFFENLVVDLMKAMNYGDGFVTKASGDDGIDGVIYEDKLGFNLIYIQAKRWNTDKTISKPEIQKFAGAMMGPPKIEKGLFITTAKFSQGAIDFANAQHIILVDGKRLTSLMIEYGLGVSVQKNYSLKRIDSDYFSEDV